MARKNYPFNERDNRRMTNLISKILVYSLLAPLLLFGIKPLDNEDSDVLGNLMLGIILLISSLISLVVFLPLFSISSFLKELLLHCIISYILTSIIVGVIILIKNK